MSIRGCDHKFVDSNHCLKCGWVLPPAPVLVCEEYGSRVKVIFGKYATHGIRHPEDSPTCEASGTEPD